MIVKYLTAGTKIAKELFTAPTNQPFIKPVGGLWASTYTPNDTYASDWVCWSSENMGTQYTSGTLITLRPDSKIYTIDNFEDLKGLCDRYQIPNEFMGFFISIDFEAIATEYDCIHLTAKGESCTRFTTPSLYGWDCESLLILNYTCIDKLEYIEL